MSVTGGFDVCIEISEALLGANVAPGLLALLPPNHEVVLDLMLPGEDGVDHTARLHLFVSELNTLARAGSGAHFDLDIGILGSALAVTGPRADHAGGLFGSILVRGVPVTLAPPMRAAPTARRTTTLMVDVAANTAVELSLFPSANDELDRLFDRLGVAPVVGRDALAEAIATWLDGIAAATLPVVFTLADRDEDGDLASFRFVALELATLPATPGQRGILALLGTLVRTHLGHGTARAKTEGGLSGANTAAVHLGEAAYRDLYFCPAAFLGLLPSYLALRLPDSFYADLPARALDHVDPDRRRQIRAAIHGEGHDVRTLFEWLLAGDPVKDLRPRLGPVISEALPQELRAIVEDTRTAERMLMPTSCGPASSIVLQDFRLPRLGTTFRNGVIRASGRAEPTRAGVDGRVLFHQEVRPVLNGQVLGVVPLEPYIQSNVGIAWWVWVLAGPAAAWLAAILNGFAQSTAFSATRQALDKALANLMPPALPTALGTATAVSVDPEHLTIQFQAAIAQRPELPELPALALLQTHREVVIDGPAGRERIDNQCLHGEYSYHDSDVQTVYMLSAKPSQLDEPVHYSWTVDGVEIRPGRHTLGGDRAHRLTATLSDDGRSLTVANESGGATFLADIACMAVDVDGLEAQASVPLRFAGHPRRYEDRYYEDQRRCLRDAAHGPGPTNRPQPAFGTGPVSIRDRLVGIRWSARSSVLRRLDRTTAPRVI
jgi:hypothetical protein